MSDGRRAAGEPMSGPEHDAWLREALRHAPDAGAAPPPTLRDAILAEARAAARTAASGRATPLLGRALEFWSWLARPQVAAGFASVMAATLVGMLWWDRPIDETMLPPPASPTVVAPPAPRSEVPPATGNDRLQEAPRPPAAEPGPRDAAPAAGKIASPRAAEDAAALETARRQQQRQATREDTDLRARAATEAKREGRSEAAKTESKDDRKAEAPTPFPARTPIEADAAVRPAEQQAARPTSPPATPSPSLSTAPSTAAVPPPPTVMAAPPAPAMAQPLPAPAAPRDDAFAAAKRAESGEKERSLAKSRSATPPLPQAPAGALGGAADSAEASAGGRSGALNSAAGSPPRQQPLAASPSARPMAPLLAALASDDTRWSRRLAGGESAAIDAPLRDWLAQVQAAAPRWDAATERSAGRDLQDRPASTTSPTTLRLDRDGRPGAIVQIEEGGVRFDPLTGSTWFAPLPPEVVARLRATLPPAPR